MPERLFFTDSDEANALIASDPMALLIGFALDQQVPVQKAFSGPRDLRERIGSPDPDTLARPRPDPGVPPRPEAPPSGRCSPSAPRSTASPARWPSACTSSPSTSATATTATPRACGP